MSKRKKSIKQPIANYAIRKSDIDEKEGSPSFSFKYATVDKYTVDDIDDNLIKARLVEKLSRHSRMTWAEWHAINHRNGGLESIPIRQIKPNVNKSISSDNTKLLATRFDGSNRRLLGYRENDVFYITHIDVNLSCYNHGR